MDSEEEEDDLRAFLESEIENWPELDQQVIAALTGLRGGVPLDEEEVKRIFYPRGLTHHHLMELMQALGSKMRYRNYDGPIPEELPPDYSKPASEADRARFKMLDSFGVSLAEEVTGIPATFVSSDWDHKMWTSKGFRFDIEAVDSGGDVPISVDLNSDFSGQLMVIDFTDAAALTVFGIELDEGVNEFRAVAKPVDRDRGHRTRLSAPPDLAEHPDAADH